MPQTDRVTVSFTQFDLNVLTGIVCRYAEGYGADPRVTEFIDRFLSEVRAVDLPTDTSD